MIRMKSLTNVIRNRSMLLNYTQIDMAELTGLSVPTIRKMENGEHNATIESWLKVLDVLGLEMTIQLKPLSDETRKSIL